MTTPVTAQSAQLLYLSDAPHYAPVLARWHFEAWRTLLPRWSEAEALAELQTHRGRCQVDTTRIALLDGCAPARSGRNDAACSGRRCPLG